MPERKECFGTIYPSLDQMQPNAPAKEKVFSVMGRSSGIGIQNGGTQADPQAWDASQCALAPLSLDQALRERCFLKAPNNKCRNALTNPWRIGHIAN